VRRRLPSLILLCLPVVLMAAPYTPSDDAQVVERVPARASDPRARELHALRQQLRRDPHDLALAVRFAQRCYDEVAAQGDPRYIGYAQAALQPWLALADPPPAVRVLRAILLQFDHRFELALEDLEAVLRAEPDHVEAGAWRTAILMVRADYAGARESCRQLAPYAAPLGAAACRAQVDAATGRAAPAAAALREALREYPQASAPERLWALTRLAEIEERRGEFAAAEAAFRDALALGVPDVYVHAAYADFLLDRGRPAEVLTLLQDRGRADVLLLRLALAARATGDPGAAGFAQELHARFDAARRRGDTSHRKEESRFALALQGDVGRALALARENWAEQREAADARILLEAALAAHDAAAAAPVLQWLADNRFESVVLQRLAASVRELR
jgi:Tfp pilus assembly protein PilF